MTATVTQLAPAATGSRSSVLAVRAQLQHYETLRAELEATDGIDEQTLLDTLEGATDLNECLLAIADEIAEREAMAAGLKSYIETLQTRYGRVEKTIETLRTIVLQAMDRAGVKSIPGQRATLTMRPTQPKLIVEDESLIPSTYFKPQAPKLDRDALKTALEELAGKLASCTSPEQVAALESIPGATLSNGGVSLTIRRK